jgi:hypothetical protein
MGIEALYNKYQQKYPYYNKDGIIEKMLNDGVITFEIAEKIKSGVSLFLLDNEFLNNKSKEVDITKIMGGNFGLTKDNLNDKTSFNRSIEPTYQSTTQGDCWLLSDLNSLNEKSWGKAAIHDAIIPDTDGSGGVTINFKGSPLKEKNIHITAKEIFDAKKSGDFSSDDDDMIAFELATEKTFKKMVELNIAERSYNDESIKRSGGKQRYYIFGGIKTKEFEQYPISELLGISTYKVDFLAMNSRKNADKEKDNLLKWVSKNQENIAGTCGFGFGFGGYGDKNSKDYIHGGHAYAIKRFDYGKNVIISDPYNSDHEIKVPWNIFTQYTDNINFSFKDGKIKEQIKNVLPKDFETYVKQDKENSNIQFNKLIQQSEAKQDSLNLKFETRFAEARKKSLKELKRMSNEKDIKIKNALKMIDDAIKSDNVDKIPNIYNCIDRDTILAILEKHPDIILWFDKQTYGWGNGRKKNYLMTPVIMALASKASDIGLNTKIIKEFESKCYNEINAVFYTDEKTIQEEVTKMVKLIKKHKNL